jgi:putative heme-binding domain-containing protein
MLLKFKPMYRTIQSSIIWLACLLISCGATSLQADENDRMEVMVKALSGIENEAAQVNILQGMLSGLAGRRDVPTPKSWPALNAKLKKSDNAELRNLAQQLSQVFGDESASQAALATLRDVTADLDSRKSALQSLLGQRHADVLPILEELLDQPLRLEAIRAYAVYDFSKAPTILLKRYVSFDPNFRRAVVETLASRKSYARALLKAMDRRKVAKSEVPAYVARSLKTMLGKEFEKVYGEVRDVSADKGKLMAQYKAKISSPAMEKADASRGRAIYQRTCLACHVMYGEGGKIGPELTGSNRADAEYLLLNVIDPNYDVPEGYRLVTITSKSGQVFAGNVSEEDDSKIVLTMVGQKSVIAKADVKSRTTAKISLMPEGLLLTLKDNEFLDLIQYLRTEKQVPLPK